MPLPVIASSLLARAGTALASRGVGGFIARQGAMKAVGGVFGGDDNQQQQPKAQHGIQAGSNWMDADPSESHWGA